MKNNITNLKEKMLFCTATLPECKGAFSLVSPNHAVAKVIIPELINEGDLVHFSCKNYLDARLFPLQICLAVSGAITKFIGQPVSTMGNCLFINDGLREESIVEMSEVLSTERKLSAPPFRTAIYRTGMDESQNTEDISYLVTSLKPVLIILDCTLIDYTNSPRELLIYPLLNMLLTLNRFQKTALVCITNGPVPFEKVPLFQRYDYRTQQKAQPFTRSILLECVKENRQQFILRSPAYPSPFEAFQEIKLHQDGQTLWFRKEENKRFLFF